MSAEKYNNELNQAGKWNRWLIDQSQTNIKLKPVAAPQFIAGILNHEKYSDLVSKIQGKKITNRDMRLTGYFGTSIILRFPTLNGKLPCGNVIVFFTKWSEKDGTTIVHDPKLVPSKKI